MAVINNTKAAILQGYQVKYSQDGITPLESPLKVKGIIGHLGNGIIAHDSILELGANFGYKIKFSVIDSIWEGRLNKFMNQSLQGGKLVFEYGSVKINCQIVSLPEGFREGAQDIEITLIQVD